MYSSAKLRDPIISNVLRAFPVFFGGGGGLKGFIPVSPKIPSGTPDVRAFFKS